jgi:hypothetical protein
MYVAVRFGLGFSAWQISSCYKLSYRYKVLYEYHIVTLLHFVLFEDKGLDSIADYIGRPASLGKLIERC